MRPYKRVNDEIKLEGVRLIWRNFAGEAKQFNDAGKRNFAIPLEADLAGVLYETGWNVKEKEKVNDEGQMERLYHLSVTVKMDGRVPPRIFMISRTANNEPRRTPLDEDTVALLDYAEFDSVDVILRPYNWKNSRGEQGVSAYLKTLFATLHQDDLEKKYAHIPIEGALELEAGDDADTLSDTGWVNDDSEDPWATNEERERKALPRGDS